MLILYYGFISLIMEFFCLIYLEVMCIVKEVGVLLLYDFNFWLVLWLLVVVVKEGIKFIWERVDIIKVCVIRLLFLFFFNFLMKFCILVFGFCIVSGENVLVVFNLN